MELTGAFWQDARDEGRKVGIKIGERRGKKAGIKEGRKQGTDEAIIKLIPDLVVLTNDHQAVINILMKKMDLSQAQAESYYKRAMEKEQRTKYFLVITRCVRIMVEPTENSPYNDRGEKLMIPNKHAATLRKNQTVSLETKKMIAELFAENKELMERLQEK